MPDHRPDEFPEETPEVLDYGRAAPPPMHATWPAAVLVWVKAIVLAGVLIALLLRWAFGWAN